MKYYPLGVRPRIRRAAQSIEDRTVAQKKAATAKASRLRVAAAKDVAREARLDEELRQLNEQTEKACAHLRAAQVKLGWSHGRRCPARVQTGPTS